ncbi:hypothetical protein FRB91_006314 [Serendipita sp. 411]|nr:hypothetical protein FRB91_006314 [Serendipita sp. 411]
MSALPPFDIQYADFGLPECVEYCELELPQTIDPSLLSLPFTPTSPLDWAYTSGSELSAYFSCSVLPLSNHSSQSDHSIPLYDGCKAALNPFVGSYEPQQLHSSPDWMVRTHEQPLLYSVVPTLESTGSLSDLEHVHSFLAHTNSPFPSYLTERGSLQGTSAEDAFEIVMGESYTDFARRSLQTRKGLHAMSPAPSSPPYSPSYAGRKRSFSDYEADVESLDDGASGSEYAYGSSSDGDDDSECLSSSDQHQLTTRATRYGRKPDLVEGDSSKTIALGTLVCGWPIRSRGKNSQMTKKGLAAPKIHARCPMVCVNATDLERHRHTDWHENVKWYCPHCVRPLCVREDAMRRHLRKYNSYKVIDTY